MWRYKAPESHSPKPRQVHEVPRVVYQEVVDALGLPCVHACTDLPLEMTLFTRILSGKEGVLLAQGHKKVLTVQGHLCTLSRCAALNQQWQLSRSPYTLSAC